jgi:non-specific serine/threonine protein kinase
MTQSFIGTTLGKYLVTDLIGQGGMATVYKGYHRELDRSVAIKVLPPHPGRDPREIERLRTEARVIARLQHPHILPLFDFDAQGDVLYLIMAFVSGGTLRDLLAAGDLPLERVEALVREVASALDYAHRQGVIHRDIKPGNILIDHEGHALLADFGIAKLLDGATTLTDLGGVVGTPAYMSPEQCQGELIDQRGDVYSLGAVVFEMLTGRPPFVSSNALALVAKHLTAPVPRVDEMRGGLPPGINDVLQQALAKQPSERHQTARAFYDAFAAALRDRPSAGTSAARVADVNAGAGDEAPTRMIVEHPHNLPAQLTSFVGRERDVAEARQRLQQAGVRLLTLIGPGGIGKTRLSIEVGASLLSEYEDGVYFLPLAPLADEAAVIKLVAQTLNLQEALSGSSPLASIKSKIKASQMLLIFDNFEHILDAAPLISELLAAAPGIKVLATSRESLFIYGEHVYTMPTLDLPTKGEDMLQSSAVRLFIERVQAMQADFALNSENAGDVLNICRQLDGLPLALELAAARVRDLSLAQIGAQIGDRLALLSKGPRDLPARQRTMRGAIEWSYDLLDAAERRTFARLGIFEGAFLAQSAQSVVGIPDLSAYVNKSLIQANANQSFIMLAVLKEFALEKLTELGEAVPVRQAHALYYRDWLEGAQSHLNGPDQVEWFARLHLEQHNFHAALVWFLKDGQFENAGRMAAVLWRYWATQSLLSEGVHWNDLVLTHADRLSPQVHAGVTQGAGRLALLRHDYERATALQETSLALYRSIGDLAGQAVVLLRLGETEYVQGRYVQAEIYLGEGLSLFRVLEDDAGIGRCLNIMGRIVMQNGEFAKAEPLLRESLSLARAHGSTEGVALALYDLASVLRAQGKYDEAAAHYRESLALYRELNFAVGIATLLYNLGFTFQGQDDYSGSMAHFVEALKLLQGLDEPFAIAECLIGAAGTFLHDGQHRLCVQTLSAIKATLTALNAEDQLDYINLKEYERLYAASQAGAPQWQDAWAEGQRMKLEQIVQMALAAQR